MTDDDTKDVVKKETKPADFATAILERKKAPNRLVVGAFDGRDVASSRIWMQSSVFARSFSHAVTDDARVTSTTIPHT